MRSFLGLRCSEVRRNIPNIPVGYCYDVAMLVVYQWPLIWTPWGPQDYRRLSSFSTCCCKQRLTVDGYLCVCGALPMILQKWMVFAPCHFNSSILGLRRACLLWHSQYAHTHDLSTVPSKNFGGILPIH